MAYAHFAAAPVVYLRAVLLRMQGRRRSAAGTVAGNQTGGGSQAGLLRQAPGRPSGLRRPSPLDPKEPLGCASGGR